MRHVVWDWNGTLLDDQLLVVHAVNVVLEEAGLPRITLERYRLLYTRPVHGFYERLFGRQLTPHEWERLDDVFHAAYEAELEAARLAEDAHLALERVTAAGRTQSLLSMYRHDDLLSLVERFGIHDHFVRVDGLRGAGGGRKEQHLVEHLEAVAHAAGTDPSRILVVGDALDDAHAAAAVGAPVVLYDGGAHPREELEQAGVPVVDRLVDALDIAEI